MFDSITRGLLRKTIIARPAKLLGFRRVRVSGESYPAIYPCREAEVDGLILEGLSRLDLAVLDRYEGRMYQRKKISRDRGLSERLCVYVVSCSFQSRIIRGLKSDTWCPETFQRSHVKAWLMRYSPAGR